MNQQLIDFPASIIQADIQEQFDRFKSKSCYSEIAKLLTFSLHNAPAKLSHDIFGYIPGLFRELAITNPLAGVRPDQLSIGEPIIYKVNFSENHTMKGIPFFYLFCYLKENSSHLNVYFQSATKTSKHFKPKEYTISQQKIKFEGIISAFNDPISAICISDPGHFIPDLISSFYVGSRQINFPEVISNLVESICIAAKIKLENTFLFGSSAGGMGALLSSTYFSQKVQVLAVNAQIITYDRVKVMNTLLGTSDRDTLIKKFANRISCLNRFQQNINSVPNIYLLANTNDDLYHRNYKFYQLYQELFIAKGKDHQSIFDSYSGVEGHSRPDKVSLKKKIEIARTILMMNSNSSSDKLSKSESTIARNNKPKPETKENNYPEIGKVSADNSAIAGKEGWFFINSGTNHLTEYHTGAKRLPLLKVDQWEQLLTQRIQWHQSRKIAYQHIFIPNKIAVYPEYYPHSLDIQGDRPILQLQKKCRQLFIYPLELLIQYKEQYQLYEKQDSHWNFWGCYLTYQLLCQKLKISPNPKLVNAPVETIKSQGDLGAKFGSTEMTLAKKIKLSSKIIYDNQVINHAHQGSVRVLQNDRIAHGKMIIFGDSFCNPGIPDYSDKKRLIARLSTLFAETLNEVHFVWTPWIDYDYIEREKPDFVLTEMAERFLVRVPDDNDHLPLEEFGVSNSESLVYR
jgi:SGNH hydrolase-like domain, acetyltransferase AlgX